MPTRERGVWMWSGLSRPLEHSGNESIVLGVSSLMGHAWYAMSFPCHASALAVTTPAIVPTLIPGHDPSYSRRVDEHAAMAASMLSFEPILALGPDRHLALLRWLTDALLETQKVRAAIQSEGLGGVQAARQGRTRHAAWAASVHAWCLSPGLPPPDLTLAGTVLIAEREETAEDVKRGVRDEISEERRRLKELLEAGAGGRVSGMCASCSCSMSGHKTAPEMWSAGLCFSAHSRPCRQGSEEAAAGGGWH